MSSLCLLGASLVYGAILTFLPIYAQQRNISDYGIFFVVYALATMGSRVFAGKLSDHVDRRLVILPFSLLVALAAMCFFIMDNVWTLGLIAILFGLGYGALVPALTALVVDVTRPDGSGGYYRDIGLCQYVCIVRYHRTGDHTGILAVGAAASYY